MNLLINPFNYGNPKYIEIVVLECIKCGKYAKKELPHSMTNTKIMKYFKGWTAKGYRNQKHTLCPKCH